MERVEVFKAIEEERAYQDSKWTATDKVNNVGDFIIYMERYLNNAKDANDPVEPKYSLNQILKVTTLGVACLEKFAETAPNKG